MTQNSSKLFAASGKQNAKRNYRVIASIGMISLLLTGLLFISYAMYEKDDSDSKSAALNKDNIFDLKKIHEIHLNFKDTTAWNSLAPVGMTGPNDWFDVSVFIRYAFFEWGDKDFDRQFTRDEFMSIVDTWTNWDTKGNGMLDPMMVAIGYGKTAPGIDLRGAPGMRNGIASLFGIQTPDGRADIRFADHDIRASSIRYKGNGTLFNAKGVKHSFKIDLNDSFPGRSIDGINKINLHNLTEDPGYMTDVITYRLFREAKVPAPRTSYAKVYATVPDSLDNHYLGLYLLLENVDNDFAMYWHGTKRGAIFKPVTPRLFRYMGNDWDTYIQVYDPKTPVSVQETNRIMEVCKFVSTASDEEFSSRLNEYFDVDNLARYLAVDVFVVDLDGILGPGQNMYMYLHPKTLQLSLIPWDHDQSFGRMGRGTIPERDSLDIDKPWMGDNIFLERLFKEPQFKLLYRQYMKEFSETLFRPERIIAQINELVPVVRPAVAEESMASLKKFDSYVGPDPRPVEMIAPGGPGEPVPVKSVREFIIARHKSVTDQLAGKSSGLSFQGPPLNMFFVSMFIPKMDADKDSLVSYQEIRKAFETWYSNWSDPETGIITFEGLADGINNDISPFGPDPKKKLVKEPEKTN